MPLQFKLTASKGVTRLASFNDPPTWETLAAKLHSLFGIPAESVAVSYVDNEFDEITLSSQEELQDYYTFVHNEGLIKFAVVDLLNTRDHTAQESSKRPDSYQDVPGNDNFELLDHDWQSLSSVAQDNIPPHSQETDLTNPFAEVLGSDVSGINAQHVVSDEDEVSPFKGMDKGKGKASSPDVDESPVSERVTNETPAYHQAVVSDNSLDVYSDDLVSDHHSESTPRAKEATVEQAAEPVPADATTEDPPLPSLDALPSSATLSNDIAFLINAFTQAVNGHPELSEGIRNILRNVTTGTYWHAHRERLSKAAHELQESTNQPNFEAEASKKLVESINQMMRSFSLDNGSGAANDEAKDAGNATQSNNPEASTDTPHGTGNVTSGGNAGPPPENVRPQSVPHPSHWPHGGFGGYYRPAYPPFHQMRPPFPPPPPRHLTGFGMQGIPPPPPLGHHPVPITIQPYQQHPFPPTGQGAFAPRAEPNVNKPSVPQEQTFSGQASTPQEFKSYEPMRANMEEAKRAYKARKDFYRAHRDVLKNHPTNIVPDTAQNAASSSRFGFDATLEPVWGSSRVNVPRRHNTHLGHTHGSDNPRRRAEIRVTKRLADMGFTSTSYPALTGMIQDCIPDNGFASKEGEDDIVTTLLEGLLATSPGSPSAPHRHLDPPGGWPAQGHDALD